MNKGKPIIVCFSIVLRGVVNTATLLMLILIIQNGGRLVKELTRYNVYTSLNGYYGISISPDIDVSKTGIRKLDDALVSFFKESNGEESILISPGNQVRLYNDGFMEYQELEVKDYVITVNEAYLKKYPIYDTDGKAVEITGDRTENYLLVPAKYMLMEAGLKEYYEENNTFLKYYIDDLRIMDIEEAHNQQHQTVPLNIIYISDGQTHDIYDWGFQLGRLNGVMKDCLIDVVTTENVSIAQIPSYVTFKDYLILADTPQKRENIEQIFKSTGLDAFIMDFNSVIKIYRSMLVKNITIILIQLLILIVIRLIIFMMDKRLIISITEKKRYFVLCWGLTIGTLLLIKIPIALLLATLLAALPFDLLTIKLAHRAHKSSAN